MPDLDSYLVGLDAQQLRRIADDIALWVSARVPVIDARLEGKYALGKDLGFGRRVRHDDNHGVIVPFNASRSALIVFAPRR